MPENSEVSEVSATKSKAHASVVMQSDQLAAILKATLLCASEDPTRFALCGVFVSRNFGAFVSTDGHRLTRIFKRGVEFDAIGAILERDGAKKLATLFVESKEAVTP